MPIYEYQCNACSKEFEEIVMREMTVACPQCGSGDTHKLISKCRFSMGGDNGVTKAAQWRAMGGQSPSKPKCGGCSGGDCASC